MGCTDLVKHKIKVTDDEPLKDKFQRIPPTMVDEIHSHVKEMLEAGAICPSQSPWCNAIMLVCKKDGVLHKLPSYHVRTKKDS